MFSSSFSFQINLDATVLDAAKSAIVYGVAKNVSTAGRAVRYHCLACNYD